MTHPLLWAIAGLGGYLVYENVKPGAGGANANQPDPNQRMPFWQGWMNQGSQPQTGNGAPTTDVTSVSNAIGDLAKFGTSIAHYFGTADSHGSPADGGGVGANSNQTSSYSSGGPGAGPWAGGYDSGSY